MYILCSKLLKDVGIYKIRLKFFFFRSTIKNCGENSGGGAFGAKQAAMCKEMTAPRNFMDTYLLLKEC